jgi:hypothetical protein
MEAVTIEILNPKAKQLLKGLADLKLISITKSIKNNELKEILNRLRNKSDSIPTLEEITKEVEIVRSKRYARKAK